MDLNEIKKIHQTGNLQQAKQAYLKFLAKNPDHTEALHLLGLLYAEEGNLEEAQRYLEKAIGIDPKVPNFYLHLANIFKAKGLYTHAIQILFELIKLNPQFAAAYNNLGTIYYVQGKFEEAKKEFQKAINLQANYVDAYYNLALSLTKLNHYQEAMHTYHALLELSPRHPGGLFQLGCLFMQQGKTEEAILKFSAIEEQHPYHFETQTNLATCHLKLGHLNEAKIFYLQALDVHPEDVQILFNLGVINMQQSLINESIHYYLRAVKVDPNLFDAHNNLAFAYLIINNHSAALLHFKEALRLQPNNTSIQHTIHILEGKKNILGSPAEYIRSLFDSYADHYDAHLKSALHYQVPQMILKLILETHPAENYGCMLDLGCGTGLCGQLFRPYVRSMVGVDLSEKMLEKAREKQIYDELVQVDLLSFLQHSKQSFDLIVAADVFVYFGDLGPVFTTVYEALQSGGFFEFNAEISENEDFKLSSSGRFAHHTNYLEKLIQKNHFKILVYRKIPMRTQREEVVQGHLYLLQKN